jgi:hypothetical protein
MTEGLTYDRKMDTCEDSARPHASLVQAPLIALVLRCETDQNVCSHVHKFLIKIEFLSIKTILMLLIHTPIAVQNNAHVDIFFTQNGFTNRFLEARQTMKHTV